MKKFKIKYSCECGCEITKNGLNDFDKSIHYYVECPFCKRKMWICKVSNLKQILNIKKENKNVQ